MRKSIQWVGRACILAVGLILLALLTAAVLLDRATAPAMGPREVPAHMVKLAFKGLTGRQLPKKAGSIRALGNSGRAEAIFVRFETNAEGMDYVLEIFGGAQDGLAEIDSSKLVELRRSSTSVFADAAGWQDELGISLYDQASIESACIFERQFEGTRHKVLIDRQSRTVYMFADARHTIE